MESQRPPGGLAELCIHAVALIHPPCTRGWRMIALESMAAGIR